MAKIGWLLLLLATFASRPYRKFATVAIPATAVVFSQTISLPPYEVKYLPLHPKFEIDTVTGRYRVVAENWESAPYNLHYMRKWRPRGRTNEWLRAK